MPMQIHPGRGLGFIALGVSLQATLSLLKSQPTIYPSIDLYYDPAKPLSSPVIINLPTNGIRLRFDGPIQRLRLIEILDFSFTQLTYDGKDVVKLSPDSASIAGPTFRHVYNRLIGPTFPGQYIPPSEDTNSSNTGSYILSYPGIAFIFPVSTTAHSQSRDFVSLLSSPSAGPAKSLAIFDAESWQEARQNLYTAAPPIPRPFSATTASRGKETRLDEIDYVSVTGNGALDLFRRSTPPFRITLNSTTQQDLLAELGPPDAIYRKSDRRLSIHKKSTHRRSRSSVSNPKFDSSHEDTDYSSSRAVTDSSADDEGDMHDSDTEGRGEGLIEPECFWNYFSHGIDVFISYPQPIPARLPSTSETTPYFAMPGKLVATKVLLHGNIPGSFPFNRYRRCRWKINIQPPSMGSRGSKAAPSPPALTSETPFSTLSQALQRSAGLGDSGDKGEGAGGGHNYMQGMVLNRGWGNSPGSSCELLGGWEGEGQGLGGQGQQGAEQGPEVGEEEVNKASAKGKRRKKTGEQTAAATGDDDEATPPVALDDPPGMGNTELFGFPGYVFEVLKNGCVSCLTVY